METNHVLELYSEKINRLGSSSLIKAMTHPGWKFSWDMRNDRLAEDARMPDLESIEAYVLNLRFFIQKNEPISWPRMSILYKENCHKSDCVERFEEIRTKFNSELDKILWYKINDQPISYRDIFLGMINSQIAHSNQINKHVLFEGLKKESFSFYLNMDIFLRCIDYSHTCLALVQDLNQQAFAYNKALNADASKAGAG